MEKSPIDDALLAHRQIMLRGTLDGAIQERILSSILHLNSLNNAPITLFFDSVGGDTRLSLYLCDAIQQSQSEVRGVVVGDGNSAAFRILQACHKRLAYPHATMIFHAPAVGSKRVDEDDFLDYIKSVQEMHEDQLQVFAQRSGQPIEQCREWARKQKRFTADEALKQGFLDEIVQPPSR